MFPVEPWLEKPLSEVDNDFTLRSCACKVARFCLDQVRERDPRCLEAISLAERVANGKASLVEMCELSRRIEPQLSSWEESQLLPYQASEETLSQSIQFYKAAAKARPLLAAMATLNESATESVSQAAYQARCAIQIYPGIKACKAIAEIIGRLAMNGTSSLDVFPPTVIDTAVDESNLRRCACEFARFTVSECDSVDPAMLDAIRVAERFAKVGGPCELLRAARSQISSKVELAADRELDAQDEMEREPSLESFIDWFDKCAQARAFNAAAAALHDSAKEAARNSLYEANSTIGTKAAIEAYRQLQPIVATLAEGRG